ncbi:hypothetical protein [Parvularcula maris]|uniref:VPLPA-CTERM sorting domain-containing protein n=1 Tax=Parvularcula maris TaxID=2965077 RepID=A0A9X2L9S1_9PROT|nr:hypothetical protein [Parvularcula maris]MCQ8185652.1 hypothetical protein [Parvularcula maris]
MKRTFFAAAAFVAAWGGALNAQAALVDGSYQIGGIFDTNNPNALLTGSFDVVGGSIENLIVETDFGVNLGDPSIYVGTGTIEAGGSMFAAALTLTNPGPSASGTGFLTFSSDGTFACGGITVGSFANTCQLATKAFGTAPSEKSGTYTIEASPVPLPVAALLFVPALGGMALTRRARRTA